MNEKSANYFGILAIIFWSSMALLGKNAANVPPFLMLFVCFLVAFLLGLGVAIFKGNLRIFIQKPLVYLVGVAGLFGYHFFYFFAIKNSPAVSANLINYLWPLLIVLFSALLRSNVDSRLKFRHVLGAFLAFLGIVFLANPFSGNVFVGGALYGTISAFLAAFTWAFYSVISRAFKSINSLVVAGFCLVSSLLGAGFHVALEEAYVLNFTELIVLILLGLGPVGGAFYLWDVGMKHGNIRLLGTYAYFTPLASTILLIAFTNEKSSLSVWLACVFIILGSVVSAKK